MDENKWLQINLYIIIGIWSASFLNLDIKHIFEKKNLSFC